MKYDHRVKVGDKWFDAGVEVNVSAPVNNEPKEEVVETSKVSTETEPKYSRTQIQQMNVVNLKEVATELGIEFDDDTTGKDLKGKILAKLGI